MRNGGCCSPRWSIRRLRAPLLLAKKKDRKHLIVVTYLGKGVSCQKLTPFLICYLTDETEMWSPCILPVIDTVCQSLPVLELACWRNVPLGSSSMYT